MASQETLLALSAFKRKNKFSDEAWLARGLNPSAASVSAKLTLIFDKVVDELIEEVAGAAPKNCKKILKKNLSQIDIFDTEEREFVCDLFMEISQIVRVDLKKELHRWLYGELLDDSWSSFPPPTVMETLVHTCQSCGMLLQSEIMQKEVGIPAYWIIGVCDSCKNHELLDLGPDIKSFRWVHWKAIDHFEKSAYTLAQALDRVKQLNQGTRR